MPKPLVPVANRPMLFHNLEALRCAGVLEATIAVEPDAAAAIRQAVGDGSDWDMAVRYARLPGPVCGRAALGPRGTSSATSRFWSSAPGRSYGSGSIRSSQRLPASGSTRSPCGSRRVRQVETPLTAAGS